MSTQPNTAQRSPKGEHPSHSPGPMTKEDETLRQALVRLGFRVEDRKPEDGQYTKRIVAPDGSVHSCDSIEGWALVHAVEALHRLEAGLSAESWKPESMDRVAALYEVRAAIAKATEG